MKKQRTTNPTTARLLSFALTAALTLALIGCDRETPPPRDAQREIAQQTTSPPRPIQATPPGPARAVTDASTQPAVAPEAVETARALVQALAAGDADAAGKLFISRDSFQRLFEGDD